MHLFSRGVFLSGMFEDYWNYSYHPPTLNMWKIVKRGIAVMRKAQQQ